jgi:hypothetical protein
MRKVILATLLIVVAVFIAVFSCRPAWELEFAGTSSESLRISVYRGSQFVGQIDCPIKNAIANTRRVRLDNDAVELPIGRLEDADFTLFPGRAAIRVGDLRITLQESGLSVTQLSQENPDLNR